MISTTDSPSISYTSQKTMVCGTGILHTVIGFFSFCFIIIFLKPPGNQTTCNDPQQMSYFQSTSLIGLTTFISKFEKIMKFNKLLTVQMTNGNFGIY